MKNTKFLKVFIALAMSFTLIFALVGCNSSSNENPKQNSSESKTSFKPFELETFGTKVTYNKVPKTIVSFNVHTTENLLALGLGDKIVGTSYKNAEILPSLKAAYDKIPQLSPKYPSMESVLNVNPEFVYGASFAFSEKATGTVADFVKNGIMPYVAKGTYTKEETMQDVYDDFDTLGKIFQITDKSNKIVSDMKSKISSVQDKVSSKPKVKVFVYDSGENDAFTAGKCLETNIITLAGGDNLFKDTDKTWDTVSWEAVVKSNPDYIIVNNYGNKTADDKINFLKSNPALKDMNAIKNNKFIIMSLPDTLAGIRNADAVENLAKQLHPDLFK